MSCDTDIDPRNRADFSDNQVMDEVPRRNYVAAVQTGLRERSPQPNVLRENFEVLKDASLNNELPKRPCSFYFHLGNTNFDIQSILQDVKQCGVIMSDVRCVQKVSKDGYTITFKTPEGRQLFSEKSKFAFHRPDVVTSVVIHDAPCELPDDALKHRLSFYGQVLKIYRRTHLGCHVETGVRVARMVIEKPLPSFLRFGRRLVRTWHDGQVPTCRRCNRSGHVARNCNEKFCFNCEGHGHEAPDCTRALLCSICKRPNHWARNCEFSWSRPHHRDVPLSDRPGSSLTIETHDSQPPLPAAVPDSQPPFSASDDISEPASPQLLSGSSSSSSGSSSSSSTTQPSPQSSDLHGDDKQDNDDDGDDDDSMDASQPDDLTDASQPDADRTGDSIPANSPTNSEELMIVAAAIHTQNDVELQDLSEESGAGKRRADSLNRKSRSTKKKR